MKTVSKIYNIPIKRKISQGALVTTTAGDCDFHLGVPKVETIFKEVSTPFHSDIYRVDRDQNNKKIIIYSNTVNLKITNKFLDKERKIPLFKVIKEVPPEALDDFKEYLKENLTEDFKVESNNTYTYDVYLNTDKYNIDYIPIEDVVFIGNSSKLKNSDVEISRVKDQIKIELKVKENVDDYLIEVGHKNLFYPMFYKNWVEFYECVFRDTEGKTIHVYNHTFKKVKKVEYFEGVFQPKDPVLDFKEVDIDESSNLVRYDSWRSNLMFDTSFSETIYFYLITSYLNKEIFKNFLMSSKTLESEEILGNSVEILKKENKISYYDLTLNPLKENQRYNLNSEMYSLVPEMERWYQTLLNEKYSHYNNIKMGNEVVRYRLEEVVKQTEHYLTLKDEREILQMRDLRKYTLNSLPSENLEGEFSQTQRDIMSEMLDRINSVYYWENASFVDPIKIYYD